MSYLKDIKPEKPVYPCAVYNFPLKKKIFPLRSVSLYQYSFIPRKQDYRSLREKSLIANGKTNQHYIYSANALP